MASDFIAGKPVRRTTGGDVVSSMDPYTGEILWSAPSADRATVDLAVSAARNAFSSWSRTSIAERKQIIERFGQVISHSAGHLSELIAKEGGKPLWDAKAEVTSLTTKIAASFEAFEKRAAEGSREVRGMTSRTHFLPHGVLAVLGPFNFPTSMGNSHILPAILAGNTVVFKPSELTPLSGLYLCSLWHEAGLPDGVLNCVSGSHATGQYLASHTGTNGVLLVGSHGAGMSLLQTFATQPEKILALEMGGNNPLVVWDYNEIDAAVNVIVQSTFLSAGQRCTAARRLLINNDDNRIIPRLQDVLSRLRVDHYTASPEPFYGPLIRKTAAERVLRRTGELVGGGAEFLLEPRVSGPNSTVVSPGLIEMTNCRSDQDEEIFGPILKVYRVSSLSEAIAKSNATKFGLAAGILCREEQTFREYFQGVRAGIINWNQQLTGATTFAPFGGVKQSGNFRPAGYMSVDYCCYSVASFEVGAPKLPATLPPGIDF